LEGIKEMHGDFIATGVSLPSLDREKKWEFKPKAQKGQQVSGGDILGTVQETTHIEHRVMVPPNVFGKIAEIRGGEFTITDEIGKLEDGTPLRLMHEWPVRKARPFKRKLDPELPFLTGQRILDTLFPIALGGTAIIPGGFGTGKTVLEQTLAKFSSADVIVYVGCGERGNEMTDVLTEFPELIDPKTGEPLMNRTILVVNTSNMPVAAREASIYTGITLAEYYRDQGYDVALMADSTSRWAEALREISSRLEEMPGEEGYPTYMATRPSGRYPHDSRKCPEKKDIPHIWQQGLPVFMREQDEHYVLAAMKDMVLYLLLVRFLLPAVTFRNLLPRLRCELQELFGLSIRPLHIEGISRRLTGR
jgi:V/A-type H+-transporting ATPase subunit A